jgi:hypothetical protein
MNNKIKKKIFLEHLDIPNTMEEIKDYCSSHAKKI